MNRQLMLEALLMIGIFVGCAHGDRQVASVSVAGSPKVEVQVLKKDSFDEIVSADFTGFVFKKEAKEAAVTWVPSVEQIHEAEKSFEKYIREANPEVYIHLRNYRRQYFGYGPDVAHRIHAYFTCSADEDLSDPKAENKKMENSDCNFGLNFEYSSRKVSGYRPSEQETEALDESGI